VPDAKEPVMPPLKKDEIKARLSGMSGWKLNDDEIEKKFQFADFKEAMAFVNRVAGAAESMDHHPDIEIKYNKVDLTLSTHSEGGVTDKDFQLAERIEAAVSADGAPASTAMPASESETEA
jgi:4a-hydroxytetrahydrobiopterin dehydratase